VAPFLHGAEALDAADAQVVWRADLRPGREEEWSETVAAAPPRSREALALPVAAVRAWLHEAPPAEVADVEGTSCPVAPGRGRRRALRWRGPEDSEVVGPEGMIPGDTLVVPAEYGGADAFGWDPLATGPVPDVGDLCVNEMADRAPGNGNQLVRLRLYPGGGPVPDGLVSELRQLLLDGKDHDDSLGAVLGALEGGPATDPLTAAVVGQLAAGARAAPYPAGVVLTARVRPGFCRPREDREDLPPEPDDTADDDTSSLRAGVYAPAAVSLREHTRGVARWVSAFASGLGLGDDLARVLERAADLHDLGKADPRFQFLLYGDEPGDTLLAKSGKDLDARQRRRVAERAHLPRGFRHEFVSVALLRRHRQELLGDLGEDRARLAEYLVGTHHGRGRPFVPVVEDDGREDFSLQWDGHALSASPRHHLCHLDARWADQFWALVRQHGYWGLAYLEALLRLADGARSDEEQRQGGTGG
jgi:CRISPR-associated endonuclease/helicase Cas3